VNSRIFIGVYLYEAGNIFILFSLLSLFWKKNKSRLMRSPCCLCVRVSPPNQFLYGWTHLHETL
jgi:hypothetical protein